MNAALQAGATVSLAQDPVKTAEGTETGAFLLSGIGRTSHSDLAKKYAVSAAAVSAPAHTLALKKARIGLYRPWAPSIDEGWTRWILENYGFEPKSLYNGDIRSADLRSRYDVIVLPDLSAKQLTDGFGVGVVPGQYAGGIGDDGLENLREFVHEGGTLIALNKTASGLIPLMSLPVQNVIEGVKSEKFFCSGALLRVETEHADLPINFGVSAAPVVMFQNGPAFQPLPGFHGAVLARYPKETNPLESGLLLHPEAIEGKAAALEVVYGMATSCFSASNRNSAVNRMLPIKYLFNELYAYDHPALPSEPVAAPAKAETPAVGAAMPKDHKQEDTLPQ